MATRRAQNISAAKLKRILEYNECLREQLAVSRITVSEASTGLIEFCKTTKDPLLPSVWGPTDKKDDPFAPPNNGGCCAIM
ncbi:G-protein gamma subunit [Chlamydoabsidia padenii]|nr:G-protein gamma subunit [Chlamydoabsidia padenii]